MRFSIGLVVQHKARWGWIIVAESAFGYGFRIIFMGLTGYLSSSSNVITYLLIRRLPPRNHPEGMSLSSNANTSRQAHAVPALAPSLLLRNLIGAGWNVAGDVMHARLRQGRDLFTLDALCTPFLL